MSSEELKKKAEAIFRHALTAVDPYNCVQSHVSLKGATLTVDDSEYDLDKYERVIVIGAGKGTAPMARAVEAILGDRISAGLVVVKYGHREPLTRVLVREAGHPLPDAAGVAVAQEIMYLISGLGEKTLVLCLLSGGGSALLVSPAEGISLDDKMETTKLLLDSGANIQEVNAVRKHLSRIKGGRLAAAAAPASIITLILSDVINDPLDVIASGPTAPDSSTFHEAFAILEKYAILEKVPPKVRRVLEEGMDGQRPETPKAGDPVFASVRHYITGNNRQALAAAVEKAGDLGFTSMILTSSLFGEAREIAKVFTAIAREIRERSLPLSPPACILAGGETTVTIEGDGRGGRNQEMALSAALELEGLKDVLFLSAGTDGTDGPTDAAGAFAHGGTLDRAKELGLDPREFLARNDSYWFFEGLGDLLITGPTKTNVMDLQVMLIR